MEKHRTPQWPKNPPTLDAKQLKAKGDFLKLWLDLLPQKYGGIEKFNHKCPLLKKSSFRGCRTLEIGAGLGEHLIHEDLENQDYTAVDIRQDFITIIQKHFPLVKGEVGDIQKKLNQPDQSFDRIIAIHVLEHLRNLPLALAEINRVLKPDGKFIVVIPCEGGLAYRLARKISAQRIFESTFQIPYAPIIQNEHVSQAWEILYELRKVFIVKKSQYWPFMIPNLQANLVIALECGRRELGDPQ